MTSRAALSDSSQASFEAYHTPFDGGLHLTPWISKTAGPVEHPQTGLEQPSPDTSLPT